MSAVLKREMDRDYPIAVHARGLEIFDEAGKSYIDMCGGAAVSALGHGDPDILSRLKAQIDDLAFAHTGHFNNHSQEMLARMLVSRFGEPDAKVYFTSGGSEANETALKLAWQYWRNKDKPSKTRIISRKFSYHGNTLGALSVSGNEGRRRPVAPVLHDWPRIDPCYAFRYRRDEESRAEYGLRTAESLNRMIENEGADRIAAFILEPVVGASLGAVPPESGYLARIREICDHHDILMIADEVMCGTGRTGTFFAFEQEGARPDIVTLAKGLGGGYQPLAATIASGRILQVFADAGQPFAHGHTYIGHASACAAGCGVVDAIEKRQLLGAVRRQGKYLHDVLQAEFGGHPLVGDIRGRGLLHAMEFVADRESLNPLPNGGQIARRLRDVAMAHGLLIYPSGGDESAGHGCHILFAPPYIVEERHTDNLVRILHAVLREVFHD